MAPPTLAARTEALLARHWWQPRPTALARALQPLSWLYGALLRRRQARQALAESTPVPVLVVGNLVAGGAGKTPVVMALVEALREDGWRPGVISRGFGRNHDATPGTALEVLPDCQAAEVGDEPLLIRRRTGAPVWVARQRLAAAQALCRRHPEVDLIIADDGLQHHALARAAEVLVFDERGIGNGLLLPAGPLREPLPAALGPRQRVLYAGTGPAPLQPAALVQRTLGLAWPLADWWQGQAGAAQPLAHLQGRPLVAMAGLASPEKFFAMLDAAGLSIQRLPQPDHARYDTLPWPAGTADVITTEKDAVKLHPGAVGGARVWVVGLDLRLPPAWVSDLTRLLRAAGPAGPSASTPPS